MTICVTEPKSCKEFQLAVKLLDLEHRTEWLVTMPTDEVIIFKFYNGNWTTTSPEKEINDEFEKAISHVISLLSIHQHAEQDLDKLFRAPQLRSGETHLRRY